MQRMFRGRAAVGPDAVLRCAVVRRMLMPGKQPLVDGEAEPAIHTKGIAYNVRAARANIRYLSCHAIPQHMRA